MARIINLICILFLSLNSYSQKLNLEKESIETIEWLNSKFIQYQYETVDVKQIFYIDRIEQIGSEYFLSCVREQRMDDPLAFRYTVKIPISKINSIAFTEKKVNYWIEIKMKYDEKAIMIFSSSGRKENLSGIEIMLNKSIDEENLKPRILKGFNYLLELYGYKNSEKF